MTTKADLFGIPVDAQPFSEAIATLVRWAREPGRRYVCTCPVYTLMQGERDARARAALVGADMVTADGMPIVLLQRRMGFPRAERVYGPDLMDALCSATADTGERHYFWGGAPGVAEQLASVLSARYPGLTIAGTHSPPMQAMSDTPDTEAIDRLNSAAPDIVWVGLGSPKQDVWMALHRPYLNAPLLIGVGAAFDFVSGAKRQAPRWMQRNGLEWLFRLAQEPARLWKRYLVYNTLFVWRVLTSAVRRS